MDQPELAKGDGPIALMISPTRELTEQIYQMAKKCAFAAGSATQRDATQRSATGGLVRDAVTTDNPRCAA